MSVKLDDLDLIKSVKDDKQTSIVDLRTIYRISLSDRRDIVELEIPGSECSVLQDMGAESAIIGFEGEILGPKAGDIVQQIYEKYHKGTPFDFYSDLALVAEVNKVLISSLDMEHIAGVVSGYRYNMVVQEYRVPKGKDTEQIQNQDDKAKEDVTKDSDIEDIRGQILDASGNPAKGVKVNVKGPGGEKQIVTDDQGYYELLDVEEGTYEITSSDEGYEDVEIEVEVKKSKSGEE